MVLFGIVYTYFVGRIQCEYVVDTHSSTQGRNYARKDAFYSSERVNIPRQYWSYTIVRHF